MTFPYELTKLSWVSVKPGVIRATIQTAAVLVTAFFTAPLMPTIVRGQQAPPEATPQRPTFTNDASITAPGTLELEFGAFSVAVSPVAEFFLRGKKGAQIGATGIVLYGFGLNSLVVNVRGKGAT